MNTPKSRDNYRQILGRQVPFFALATVTQSRRRQSLSHVYHIENFKRRIRIPQEGSSQAQNKARTQKSAYFWEPLHFLPAKQAGRQFPFATCQKEKFYFVREEGMGCVTFFSGPQKDSVVSCSIYAKYVHGRKRIIDSGSSQQCKEPSGFTPQDIFDCYPRGILL